MFLYKLTKGVHILTEMIRYKCDKETISELCDDLIVELEAIKKGIQRRSDFK